MADDQSSTGNTTGEITGDSTTPAKKAPAKRAAAKRAPAKKAAAKKTTAKKAASAPADAQPDTLPLEMAVEAPVEVAAAKAPAKRAAAKKAPAKKAAAKKTAAAPAETPTDGPVGASTEASATAVLFQAPEPTTAPRARKTTARKSAARRSPVAAEPELSTGDEGDEVDEVGQEPTDALETPMSDEPGESDDDGDDNDESDDDSDDDSDDTDGERTGPRRRRRRGGRRRRKSGDGPTGDGQGDQDGQGNQSGQNNQNGRGNQDGRGGRGNQGSRNNAQDDAAGSGDQAASDDASDDVTGDGPESGEGTSPSSRRRRRRRRDGEDGGQADDSSSNAGSTTTRVRRTRSPEDEITAIAGSTRMEAKKQRRREGREAGRRRAPIVSEAEFLARRESVERVMVVRQRDEVTQIGVLEDKVLVEHYVARESQTSLIGNVYLGRVQNVLPSMEAAFIDIGKGRNAVLYAGEVNWSALGHKDGQGRKIESVLSSGQTILVQVTKDPIGHKGARLTSQVSLAGRFLVYVPDGTTSGISRKLPDTERNRLKTLLKEIVPDTAGVIVRTAAEGASEEELTTDVERLKTRWDDIEAKTKAKASSPQLLYGEPDLTLKVVRDLFTEDFATLVVQGDDAWDTVRGYVADMAPDLEPRLEKYVAAEHNGVDLFAAYRIEEQISKALDRKVFLPSGGSLVIDRTEAMTVVDVNTGKFTGSGGNLEETVTKNNLEAAEEVVRQLRLRDIGGIIVVDFIDMVLESNRDLVLRRMVECLGRDRTRHQVAEVTSLGLVQMTRKRIGTGLLEAFSENCAHCQGRGVVIHDVPIDPDNGGLDDEPRRGNTRRRGGRGRDDDGQDNGSNGSSNGSTATAASKPSPAEFAAMAKAEVHREEQEAAAAVSTEAPSEAPAVQDATTEPAAPRVVTRSRRGASRTSPVSTAEVSSPAPVDEPVNEPVNEPAVAVEPVAPKVVTRTRRGASRTSPVSTAEVPAVAETPAVTPVEAPAVGEPATQAAVEPVAPAEPAAPKVVTRSRRGVSRTVATAAPAQPVEVSGPVVAPAPVAVQGAPEPPKVVTRTRGGASSRAAATAEPAPADQAPADLVDVPATSGSIGTPAESGAVEPSVADVEPGANEVDHVPVKKKGTRKR